MDKRTSEERLSDLLTASEPDVQRSVDNYVFKRKHVRLGSVLRTLMSVSCIRAIHAYFVLHDMSACKQNAYVATRLSLLSVGQDGGSTFETIDDFFYAFLSDEVGVIDALARIEIPELLRSRNNPLDPRFFVYMIQMALRGEDDILRQMIEKMGKNGRKPDRVDYAAGNDFFSLLLAGNKQELEDFIYNKHAKKTLGRVESENFLSLLGTLETKLCWLKGIPVQIDSPWIPMELMPVRPLAHYDDTYEFLKPGWQPPRQGLLGSVSRWFNGGKSGYL